jgi:hypothetical protein
MGNKKEITIDESTKGILLFFRRKSDSEYKWLILIHSVKPNNCCSKKSLRVYSHVSYCLKNGATFVNDSKPGWWGYTDGYELYEPTKEQKLKVINLLKDRKLKFISVLNKLIRIK